MNPSKYDMTPGQREAHSVFNAVARGVGAAKESPTLGNWLRWARANLIFVLTAGSFTLIGMRYQAGTDYTLLMEQAAATQAVATQVQIGQHDSQCRTIWLADLIRPGTVAMPESCAPVVRSLTGAAS